MMTSAELDTQLDELERLAADLEAQQAAVLAEIGRKLTGDTTRLTKQYSEVDARLKALPAARDALRAQRDQIIQQRARVELEASAAELYRTLKAADELNGEIGRARAVLAQLEKQQRDLRRHADRLSTQRGTRERELANHVLSPGEIKAIQTRYNYVELSYPGRDQLMAKRAAAGTLPPDEIARWKPSPNGKGKTNEPKNAP